MNRLLKFILISGVLFILCPFVVAAHDGIHEQIVAVTKDIRKSPKDSALYLKRAELYRLHKEWRNSERDLGTAESISPKLIIVELGRGKLWLDSGQYAKAKTALERFLERESSSYEGNLTIARVYVKLNDIASSRDYFTRAIEISPGDSMEIYLERSDALVSAGEFASALNGLDDGIRKLGQISTLVYAAIDLEIKHGNYEAALHRLDRFMADLPSKESHLLRRAQIQLMAGKRCDARESLLASQSLYEAIPPARKNVRAIQKQAAQVSRLLLENPETVCSLRT